MNIIHSYVNIKSIQVPDEKPNEVQTEKCQ